MAKPNYLDFNVLARIDSMQLLAERIVEGFILGLHRSPYRGFSVEFAEYRQYSPGDEIRHIDWKVFAKTDRYYLKQFEEETNAVVHIILDASASMGYRSREDRMSKLEYGATMAACLTQFMMRQRDAAGLMVFDTKVRTILPARLRASHLKHVIGELEKLEPGGETDIAGPLHELAEGLKRRGLVILISDLIDDPAKVMSALQHFRFQGHDVLVFQIMDQAELTFPFTQLTEFTDLETNEKQLVAPDAMRAHYLEEMRRFLISCEKGCASIQADYRLFDTTKPIELALSEYLHRRSNKR